MALPGRTLAVVLCFVFVCLTPRAISQTQAKKESNASVSGKVTIKGKPAAGIVIGLHLERPNSSSPTYKATTNEDGFYLVNNIANGTYQVAPVATALVIADDSHPRGASIVITEGDTIEHIDFDLQPGGVITGRVTDAEGRPVIEMPVSLSPVEQPDRRVASYPVPGGRTDDRGVYRVFGVRSGRYKVAVGYDSFSRGRPQLPVTYYPDERDVNKAATVDVDEGAEVTNIDIKVGPPVRTFTVTGRVVEGDDGKPVPQVWISLSRIVTDGNRTTSYGEGAESVTDSRGQFRLGNIAPGKYEVSIYAGEGSDFLPQGPVRFEVVDTDVTDLAVKLTRGALISGVVVVEGSQKVFGNLFSGTYVIVRTVDDNDRHIGATSARVKPDGTFVVGGLGAGNSEFLLGFGGRESGLKLLRVERDGVVQANSVPVRATEHISGIRLVASYADGSIAGVIKFVNGTFTEMSQLRVQLDRTDEPKSSLGIYDVDTRGHFLAQGLAAGTYQITVTAYLPKSFGPPLITRQSVTVTDGAVSEVTVTIDLKNSQ